jgi:hypothetical protein
VVEFERGPVPAWMAIPQSSALFYHDASGHLEQLRGTAGIKLTLRSTDVHTRNSGSHGFVTGFPSLRRRGRSGTLSRWRPGVGVESAVLQTHLHAPLADSSGGRRPELSSRSHPASSFSGLG